jgi:aspartyl-tRNA(Asn)/glutamyl-tRNA(Gln) amidotransferase subunit A
LRAAGAIIIGTTNLHEFAFGTTGDETAFGVVHHPFDYARSAGGSSSGAAVALVQGMCLASIGTDTGGSIRIPSAACGIVGLKPTYGELPCDGIVPLSSTFDHVGPMTLSVEDARLVFEVLKGSAGSAQPGRDRPITFGVPTGYLTDRLDPEIRAALARVRGQLSRVGHAVCEVDIRHSQWTPDVYLHIVLPEASRYHAATLESDPSGYSPGVRLRLEMGRYLLAEDYARAMHLRAQLTANVNHALDECDVLLLPTLPIVAPLLGASTVDVEGRLEPVRAATLRLTQLFNVTGHPAIALPAGRNSAGLPISMQLVAKHNDTERLLAIAAAVERQITDGFGSVGGGAG